MSALGTPASGSRPDPGYTALVSHVAVWVDPDRALLRIEGTRAGGVLNGLLSADVTALETGGWGLSFVLTSKGRPVAVPRVLRLDDAFLLDVSRGAVPGLIDHLGTYLPPRFASVTALEDYRRISLLGPGAAKVAAEVLVPGSLFRVDRPAEEGGGADFYVPGHGPDQTAIESAALAAGGAVALADDYETWRIEQGIPRFGLDVTADNLPQETGLVPRAVDFDKGCYTGQEVVARIHYRGQVNRHLRGIRPLDPRSEAVLPHGTELVREGRAVGFVTSWCASPRFGPIGLGYVRRELGPGDAIEADSETPTTCVVTEIPFTLT
ncbi:MAG: hypothetical protein KJO44_01635 [Gemmatimonadetes bacterium]|nr:hypothetical protein [Gemmatimonadota bacterium]